MAETYKPFFTPLNHRGRLGLCTRVELVETWKPCAKWATYMPTGRRRSTFFCVPIPNRVARWLLPFWIKVVSWVK